MMDARAKPKSDADPPILTAALSYAARGWFVFPAHSSGAKKSHKSAKLTPSGLPWGMSVDEKEIRDDFAKFKGCNVSIVTGEVSGIFVVECDTKVGHDIDGAANLAEWEKANGELPPTLMAISPTGSVHRYFKHPGKKVWSSSNTIAPGVDCKGDGAMVIAPPSVMPARAATADKPAKPGGAYRWLNEGHPIADAPQALLDIIRVSSSTNQKRLNEAPKTDDDQWTDFFSKYSQWSQGLSGDKWRVFNTKMLGVLSAWFPALFPGGATPYQNGYRVTSKWFGRDLQEDLSGLPIGIYDFGLERGFTPIDLVIEHKHTDFSDAVAWLTKQTGIKVEDDDEEPIQGTTGETNDAGVVLEDFYASMQTHSYIFAPTGDLWPAGSVDARVPPVLLRGPDGTPVLRKGKEVRVRASRWLDRFRAVEQMTWCPGMPPTVADRLISDGGWVERKGVTVFNTYRPPVVCSGNSANADRWVDLVKRVYPEDWEHIITFAAHRVQHPEVKINHGLILGGAPGIGKDTMLEPLKHGVGPWNFKEISPPDIMASFNDFMRCTVLRISEAHDLGEVNRFTFYDRLKTMLATPPDVVRINAKYVPQCYALNVAGIILTTNHRFDGIYLPADDRRTYVAWSEVKQADFVGGFWSGMWGWYGSGGTENVVAYLAEYDLSRFDPKAPPRKTNAFWQIVGAGAAPEESDLADILDQLGVAEGARDAEGKPCGPTATTLAKVLALASGGFFEWMNDRKNRRVIPHRFERCGYVPVRNNDAKDGLWVIGGRRQVVYGRSDLPVDERLEAARAVK